MLRMDTGHADGPLVMHASGVQVAVLPTHAPAASNGRAHPTPWLLPVARSSGHRTRG